MSQEELVKAYVEGQVSRRTLIRRLIASGVSVGAAVSYAQLLEPEAASARARRGGVYDHYPLVQLSIKTGDLGNAIDHARIRVHVATSEELEGLRLAAFLKRRNRLSWIGESLLANFAGAGERTVSVKLFNTDVLKHRRSATIYVYASNGQDAEKSPAYAFTRRILRK
jgi:hypothetical protein